MSEILSAFEDICRRQGITPLYASGSRAGVPPARGHGRAEEFAAGTTYNVTVIAAKDLAGNSLRDAPVRWSFSTAGSDITSPQVQSTFPRQGMTGVELDASIVVTFSEAIDVSTLAVFLSPDPGGRTTNWDNTNQVVTLKYNHFAPGTAYMVSISQAQDLAGNSLADAPVTWSFSTLTRVYLPVVMRSLGH